MTHGLEWPNPEILSLLWMTVRGSVAPFEQPIKLKVKIYILLFACKISLTLFKSETTYSVSRPYCGDHVSLPQEPDIRQSKIMFYTPWPKSTQKEMHDCWFLNHKQEHKRVRCIWRGETKCQGQEGHKEFLYSFQFYRDDDLLTVGRR